MKYYTPYKLLLLFFLISCSSGENKDIATYSVINTDFENILNIEGFIEPVRSTTIVCPRVSDGVITFLVEDGTIVKEGETVCVIEVKELETSYSQLQVDLENTKAELNKTKADALLEYSLLEAQVKNNEADTKIAQMDSLQLQYATATQKRIKELELKRVAIEKNRYEKKLKALAVIQQSEIRKRELEIQRMSNRVQSVEEQLEKLTLKTAKDGLAIRSNSWSTGKKLQVGDPVWGNMPLVNIPEMKEMKVMISASETDYKYINVGDSVCYTFDAMPGNTGTGRILKKAPVGQPKKRDSKVKFFEIEASLDSCPILPEPGFTANCRIILKQVKDTIVIPQIAVFEEDSIKVVYVKKEKGYEMRQISIGLTSPKDAIITTGLKRKETISLSKPSSGLVKEKTLLPDSIK